MDAFIDKIKEIILNHLDDSSFGVKQLASELGLSRSQTLRKVKASTGKSVSKLIKEIRLKEGAKLIQETDLTASEIAYRVGLIWVIKLAFSSSRQHIFDELIVEGFLESLR